jgi:hypothetical protein
MENKDDLMTSNEGDFEQNIEELENIIIDFAENNI